MVTIPELSQDAAQLQQRIEKFHAVRDGILTQVRQVIVGQEDVLDQILIALFVGGHCLITGLPGTAKTLMVRTIAETLGLTFRRIQFTPDLMPSDITGTDIIEEDLTTGHRKWTFVQGPIFGNIVLADEINRTPPKTQSALARSDAGALLHRARPSLSLAGALLRARHAESNRARRHLPAARSATRPLPLQLDPRLPERQRRTQGRRPTTTATRVTNVRPSPPRRSCSTSSSWSAWCPSANRWRSMSSTWCAPHDTKTRMRPTSSRSMSTTAAAFAPRSLLCWRPRRVPFPAALPRHLRRHHLACHPGTAPSHPAQLPCRVRARGCG